MASITPMNFTMETWLVRVKIKNGGLKWIRVIFPPIGSLHL
jgi:hypothetical protein